MNYKDSIEHMADEAAAELAGMHPQDQKIVLAAGLKALEEYLEEQHPEMPRQQRGCLSTLLLQRVKAKLAAGEIEQPQGQRMH